MHPIATASSSTTLIAQFRDALLNENTTEADRMLKEYPELLEKLDDLGLTPLLFSIEYGLPACVRLLLVSGADVSARCPKNTTCLHFALESGFPDIVDDLIRFKADINARDNYGDTPLHNAAHKGNLFLTRKLVEANADHRIQNHKGETPLHIAISLNFNGIASYLLMHQAPVNVCTTEGSYPLLEVCKQDNMPLIRAILSRHPDLTVKDSRGDTVLHKLAEVNNSEAIQLACEQGANLATVNLFGDTPLHVAAENCSLSAAESLLSLSRETLNTQNYRGGTPLFKLFEHYPSFDTVGEHEFYHQMIALLLEAGANPNIPNENGYFPVACATHEGDEDAALLILKSKTKPIEDINADDEFQNTYLHLASASNMLRLVNALIERGAEINIQNSDGETPLLCAVQNGAYKTAEALLISGANPDIPSATHLLPLVASCHDQPVEMTQLLIEYGVNVAGHDAPQNPLFSGPLTIAYSLNKADHLSALLNAGAPTPFSANPVFSRNALRPTTEVTSLYITTVFGDQLFDSSLPTDTPENLLAHLYQPGNPKQLRNALPLIRDRDIARVREIPQKTIIISAARAQRAKLLYEENAAFYIRLYFQKHLQKIQSRPDIILLKTLYERSSGKEKKRLLDLTPHPLGLLAEDNADMIAGLDITKLIKTNTYKWLTGKNVSAVRNRLHALAIPVEKHLERKINRMKRKNSRQLLALEPMRTSSESPVPLSEQPLATPHFNAKRRSSLRESDTDTPVSEEPTSPTLKKAKQRKSRH